MKRKLLPRMICAVLAALLVMGLTACGGGGKSSPSPTPVPTPVPTVNPAVGEWTGEYRKFVGDPDDAKNTEDPFTLVLTEDGKGFFKRDDNEFEVSWTLEGEAFTMQETYLMFTNDYTGILKDDALNLFNGDPEDIWTCEYVFHRSK